MEINKPLNTIFNIKKDHNNQDLDISLNWLDLKNNLNQNNQSYGFLGDFESLIWSASPVFAVTAIIGGAWLYQLSTQLDSQLMASSFQWHSYLELLEKVV